MIQNFHLKHLANKDQVSGYLLITLRGRAVARRVVVNENQTGSFMFNGTFFNLTGLNMDTVQRSFKQVFAIYNLVLAI